MQVSIPRICIGGTHSGCGKTTVTTAILQALALRKQNPIAFKCGPDYIDPMFHSEAIGVSSRNLDLFFCEEDVTKHLFIKNAKEHPIAVIEGVMGYYDGVGGNTSQASTCHLANTLQAPTVLVLSPKGASLSIVAMLAGFLHFAKNTIAGVVFNQVRKEMYPFYKDMVETHLGIPVYGYLPPCDDIRIESRHLGLQTATELKDLKQKLHKLASLAEDCIDLDGLQSLARSAPPLQPSAMDTISSCVGTPVRIGIAKDRAFCFYYQDNLDLLEELGATLVPFSPLKDVRLPLELDGVYLGGGYPELYLDTLSHNQSLKEDLRQKIQSGMPTFAECGGFMYLQDVIDGYPMVGAIAGSANLTKRLQHFGYITLTAQQDTMLCKKGDTIRAHEFHYSSSTAEVGAFVAQKAQKNRNWRSTVATKRVVAGYPHLHFYANTAFAKAFIEQCMQYKGEKKHGNHFASDYACK